MSVRMPEPDREVLLRREDIVAAMRAIVPGEGVIAGEREMRPFETGRDMKCFPIGTLHLGFPLAGPADRDDDGSGVGLDLEERKIPVGGTAAPSAHHLRILR